MDFICNDCKEKVEVIKKRRCADKLYRCHKCSHAASSRRYNARHPDRKRETNLKWESTNPGYKLQYEQAKYANNLNYKLAVGCRARLRLAIKGNSKVGSAIRDLGCSISELKLHLENKFYLNLETGQWMSWECQGKWHIDHIIPLKKFDLTDKEQFLKAVHYTNLQPLWALDNLKKGAKS